MPADPLSAAKSAVSSANNFTKSVEGTTPSRFAAKPAPVAAPAKPMAKAAPTIGQELGVKAQNINEYTNAPKMHKGGVVPGKEGEEVPIIAKAGEKVIPADSTEGRSSEYRKVYVARRQSRSGGGNKPVTETPEKHDSKKAKEGIKEKKD
jgi:hypothetical protein